MVPTWAEPSFYGDYLFDFVLTWANFEILMKHLIVCTVVVLAFTASSVFAGSCDGCKKDKSKDSKDEKEETKKSLTVEVSL